MLSSASSDARPGSTGPAAGGIRHPLQGVIDAHVHLTPSPRYTAREFLADVAGGSPVAAVVLVECGACYDGEATDLLAPVAETTFGAAEAEAIEAAGVRVGVVAHADLRAGAAVSDLLQAHQHASGARLKGIRQRAARDPTNVIRSAGPLPPAALLSDPRFLLGFAQLGPSGLSFDAWVYFHQLSEVVALASAFPETSIVLNHLGGPLGVGPYSRHPQSVFDQWSARIREVARCANVAVKLGGLGMSHVGFRFHQQQRRATPEQLAAAWRPYVETCIEAFGPARAMFESNFPVDRATGAYAAFWDAFKLLTASYGEADNYALFAGTAARVYGLAAD
jgi:L-fuconolactonase